VCDVSVVVCRVYVSSDSSRAEDRIRAAISPRFAIRRRDIGRGGGRPVSNMFGDFVCELCRKVYGSIGGQSLSGAASISKVLYVPRYVVELIDRLFTSARLMTYIVPKFASITGVKKHY